MPLGYSRNIFPELFSTDKWHDLTAGQGYLWLYLIAGEHPTRCGIVPIRYHAMIAFSKGTLTSRAEVDEALELFASPEYGWVETDGKFVWVCDFIEDQTNSTNWAIGALDEAYELRDKTHLASRCIEKYQQRFDWKPGPERPKGRRSDGKRTASGRRTKGVKTPSERRRTPSERKSQSQSQSQDEASPGGDAAAKAAERPYTDADLDLAGRLIEIIERVAASGEYQIIASQARNVQAIASGIHRSGLSHEQISETFQWAARDAHQRATLVKMARWTVGSHYQDLRNKYQQQREIQQAGETAVDVEPEQQPPRISVDVDS